MSSFRKKGPEDPQEKKLGTDALGQQPQTPSGRTSASGGGIETPKTEPPAGAAEPAPKKRYYSPQEVMKKKGCIGCGGMGVLAMLIVIAGIVLAIVIL